MSLVAYQGEIEFDGAFWDDQNGWRVRWRLIGDPASLDKANPMKRYTKRRGDRNGTRFTAALHPVSFGQPFTGEVMLAGWGDSTRGWTAIFEHSEEPGFVSGCLRRGNERPGTRYMAALVEMDDEDHAVDQQQRERAETGQRPLLLSNRAAMLVKNPAFLQFLHETVEAGDWDADSANTWLKIECGLSSRADLDDTRNTRMREKYLQLVQRWENWRDG